MDIKGWYYNHFTFGKKDLSKSESQIINDITLLISKQVSLFLWNQTLRSKETGISNGKICDEEVVVSLTTYGDRIYDVHLAIESIMQQTVKPNRIILWLAEDEFKEATLPVALKKQEERGLEIAYCKDIKSYKKLIPSLTRFPDASIITVDDDSLYEPDLLEKIITAHIKHPSDICATRIHTIKFREDGLLDNYNNWSKSVDKCPENNNMTFFTGGAGTLYPRDCFPDEVFNQKVFMDICRTSDDVWFNAMRLLKGTRVTKVYSSFDPSGDYIPLLSSNINPLWNYNRKNGNDDAIKAVYTRYGLYDKLKR